MPKILVAEDDEETRQLLKSSLENSSYNVVIVKNGREAIQHLIMQQSDLILLDLMMPGIDGAEVIRTIRSTPELASMYIIVLTAVAYPDTIEETALADLLLYKPVPIDELLAHIQSFF